MREHVWMRQEPTVRPERRRAVQVVRRRPVVVGAADDEHEREADALADLIVRRAIAGPGGGAAPVHVRAQVDGAPVGRIRRSTAVGAAGGELGGEAERMFHAARSGGAPMDRTSTQRFGAALGTDLSGVRIHTDSRADRLSRSIGALAFTSGKHIFFRSGQYRGDDAGQRLLAHELTHVVQQEAGAGGGRIQRKIPKSAHPGLLDEFNRIEGRATGTAHKDQGIASQPVNYHAPQFTVQLEPGKKRFSAKVVLATKASEGDSEATYLAPGMHDSGFLWGNDPNVFKGVSASNRMLTPAQADRNDDEHVIFNITSAVAKQSKAAEQEHLDDYRYAYGLSLKAAQDAIRSVAKRRFKHANGMIAATLARQALQQEVTNRSNGHLTTLVPTDWETKYKDLFRRSGIRDTSSWHLQDMTENPNFPNATYNGQPAVIVDVAPGASFRLDVTSAQQIDPGNNPMPVAPIQINDDDAAENDEEV
jgi:hypothetical protein